MELTKAKLKKIILRNINSAKEEGGCGGIERNNLLSLLDKSTKADLKIIEELTEEIMMATGWDK